MPCVVRPKYGGACAKPDFSFHSNPAKPRHPTLPIPTTAAKSSGSDNFCTNPRTPHPLRRPLCAPARSPAVENERGTGLLCARRNLVLAFDTIAPRHCLIRIQTSAWSSRVSWPSAIILGVDEAEHHLFRFARASFSSQHRKPFASISSSRISKLLIFVPINRVRFLLRL